MLESKPQLRAASGNNLELGGEQVLLAKAVLVLEQLQQQRLDRLLAKFLIAIA